MLNRQTIVEKVSNSADRYGASNPQQLNQLLRSLANASDNELFFGLFSFFMIQLSKVLLSGNK